MLYRIKVVYGYGGRGGEECRDIFYVKAQSQKEAIDKLFEHRRTDPSRLEHDKIVSLELEELEAKLIK